MVIPQNILSSVISDIKQFSYEEVSTKMAFIFSNCLNSLGF